MAEHHVTDLFAVGVGTGQGFFHHQGGQLGRGHVFQAATIGANRGAHTADNDDFTHLGLQSGSKVINLPSVVGNGYSHLTAGPQAPGGSQRCGFTPAASRWAGQRPWPRR